MKLNSKRELSVTQHSNVPEWPDPPARMLVMQYIQRCGGSGLVHETRSTTLLFIESVLGAYQKVGKAVVVGTLLQCSHNLK